MHLDQLDFTNLSCLEKQALFIETLNALPDKESFYHAIIRFGRTPTHFPVEKKVDENLVQGCQSALYLNCDLDQDKVIFSAFSEALLSMGMAKLFLVAYSNETVQTLFSTPPLFGPQLRYYSAISLGRQQGMEALFLKMKLLAVHAGKHLV